MYGHPRMATLYPGGCTSTHLVVSTVPVLLSLSLIALDQFDLFSFIGDDKQVFSKLYVASRKLNLQSSPKNSTELTSYTLEERMWYHVAVTHTKHRFQVRAIHI